MHVAIFIEPSDYSPITDVLIFGVTSLDTLCFNISTEEDNIVETDEMFTVGLSTNDDAVLHPMLNATVEILDDDSNAL